MSDATEPTPGSPDEAAAPPKERRETEFITWHASANGLHLRSASGILFIDKKQTALVERAKTLHRGQRIVVTGALTFSSMLSNHVFAIDSLEAP